MKDTAFICICTEEYIKYYDQLFESVLEHSPGHNQILYYLGHDTPQKYDQVININQWYNECDPTYSKLEAICSLRARAVLDAFSVGFDNVVFLGAKVKFFGNPHKLLDPMNVIQDPCNAVVTPHITKPLPEDGKFPNNASVSFTGHISTDVVSFRNCPEIIEFLKWQDEIMKTQCRTTNQIYLDQSWLNFLPFVVDRVKILRDPTYNIAYWNYKQRNFKKYYGTWYVETDYKVIRENNNEHLSETVYDKMVCFQFSGLDLNNPENISTHQNRDKADGDFLEFLTDYAEKVK